MVATIKPPPIPAPIEELIFNIEKDGGSNQKITKLVIDKIRINQESLNSNGIYTLLNTHIINLFTQRGIVGKDTYILKKGRITEETTGRTFSVLRQEDEIDILDLARQLRDKIYEDEKLSDISAIDKRILQTIKVDKTTELADPEPLSKKNQKLVALLSLVLLVGFVAICFDTGVLLHANIPIHSKALQFLYGADKFTFGISSRVTPFALGSTILISIFALMTLVGLKYSTNNDDQDIKKDIDFKTRKYYVDSNINDFTGIIFFALSAFGIINPILGGITAIATGLLLIRSGKNSYIEGLTQVANGEETKNIKEINEGRLTYIFGLIIVLIGVLFLPGVINSVPAVALNAAAGLIMILISKDKFIHIKSMYDEIKATEDEIKATEDEIKATEKELKYLKSKFTLTEEEKKKIHAKVYNMSKEDCDEYAKKNKLDSIKDMELQKMCDAIYNQEIFDEEYRKTEIMKDILSTETFLAVLKLVNKEKIDKTLQEVFSEVSAQITKKYMIESFKLFLYVIWFIVPLLQVLPNILNLNKEIISEKLYDIISALILLGSLGININPKNRNVKFGTEVVKTKDINFKLKAPAADSEGDLRNCQKIT